MPKIKENGENVPAKRHDSKTLPSPDVTLDTSARNLHHFVCASFKAGTRT